MELLDLKNIVVDTNFIVLPGLEAKILPLLGYGSHLGYFIFPKGAKVASCRSVINTHQRYKKHQKTLGGP